MSSLNSGLNSSPWTVRVPLATTRAWAISRGVNVDGEGDLGLFFPRPHNLFFFFKKRGGGGLPSDVAVGVQ